MPKKLIQCDNCGHMTIVDDPHPDTRDWRASAERAAGTWCGACSLSLAPPKPGEAVARKIRAVGK